MIFKQIDLVDSCFSFFGFEITASTLMAKTSSMSRVPLPREMPADHLNALARFSIVSDNSHAFEFARQRATGEEQLLALKATIRPLQSNSFKLAHLIWQCLLSPEKHSLSPCGCQLVPLGSAVLAMTVLWMQLSWPPSP